MRPVKRIRRDQSGADSLLGPFVFVATFVVIGAMAITYMGETFNAENEGSFIINTGREIIGTTIVYFLDPTDGVNVTGNYTSHEWHHDDSEYSYYFENDTLTGDIIEMQVITDNEEYSPTGIKGSQENLYEDYIMLYTEWGWWSQDEIAISFWRIIADQVPATNHSITYFEIHDGNYSLVVTTAGNPDTFDVFVDAGYFNVRIGIDEDNTRDQTQDTSMWTILRQLFTASLPDVNPVVNVMIATPFWACTGFMAVMIVRAFIPFMGG